MSTAMTIRISMDEMQKQFHKILIHRKFPQYKAEQCASVFTNNSLDGIYSHGINRFPRFVEYIDKGYIKPLANAILKGSIGSIEQWHGQYAPGPCNALFASDRAMELADKNGMGMVALSHTNHWMRGGTYGWECAKKGFAFIGWTNTIANMPAWGAKESKLGNNPLVIAIPYKNEALVLDMAMSQYSYGKMEDLKKNQEELAFPGGFNRHNQLSTKPTEILETGRALPIGYWKGSGLSLMLDIMATIFSAGLSTTAISNQSKDEFGVSQVFIAIDLKQLANFPSLDQSINQIITDYLSAEKINPNISIRYPGQKIINTREENKLKGIPVNKEIWETIISL